MSPELLHLIHKQKSAHRRVIKNKRRDVDLIAHHRKLRNQVNNIYRRLKNEYFQLRLQQYRKSPRHLWSAINHITGRHRQHHPSTAKLSDLIAHFRSLLFQPDQTNVLPSGPDKSSSFCEFSPVSSQVEELIMDLGNDKAAGPDGILPSELKMVANKISYPLSILFNKSLSYGSIPEDFKIGHLILLFKYGKKDSAKAVNYRGITLTCILSKVLEKIVHSQLCEFLHSSAILSENQYGFW